MFWALVCVMGLLAPAAPAWAQDDTLAVADTVFFRGTPPPYFPNINKVDYYANPKEAEKIRRLVKKQDWEQLYPVLKEYVSNFGIRNFYQDTPFLWRLAKLEELYGDFELAKLYYKLVLKHHKDYLDVKRVELHYDSVTALQKNYYVPVEYYYELVDYRSAIDTLRPARGQVLNLGPNLNSGSDDYAPAVSPSDSVLIFSSKRNMVYADIDVRYNEDLFIAAHQHGGWMEAKPMVGVNSLYNEGSACLSRDGQTLYFVRCGSPKGYGNCDLYSAQRRDDSTWTKVRNLGVNVNSKSWDSHPSLSHSEDTLYFASDRLGGFGLSDIYYTYKLTDSTWAEAQNLGPIINTQRNEVSPFYHPLFDVLYFSSNGHILNIGNFDIYKSFRLPNMHWSEPENVGPLVNTEGNEFYFSIDKYSHHIYYAKTKDLEEHVNLDLYTFPLPMGGQPMASTRVSGRVIDRRTGLPPSGIVSVIDLDTGIEVAPRFLRPDGTFDFALINEKNYMLVIQGDDFFRLEDIFYLDGDRDKQYLVDPVYSKMEFSSIEFEPEQWDILPIMYADLDRLADFLLDNPRFKVRINGHTDGSGSATLNQELSLKRAEAIRDYLTYFGGVPPFRVEAVGHGSSQPIKWPEQTAEDRALNRRVEFELWTPPEEEMQQEQEEYDREQRENWFQN